MIDILLISAGTWIGRAGIAFMLIVGFAVAVEIYFLIKYPNGKKRKK